MRRILVAAVAGFLSIVAAAPHAGADGQNAVGWTTPDGGRVIVVDPGVDSGANPGSGSGSVPRGGGADLDIKCWLFLVVPYFDTDQPGVGEVVTDTSALEAGTQVWRICRNSTNGDLVVSTIFAWDPARPSTLAPTAAELAQVAMNQVSLSAPRIRTWPPTGSVSVVGVPVWLHVEDWAPVSASATAGGLTATVQATPVRATWQMDDGSVTCSDAGTVYDPASRVDPGSSSCSFTYLHSSGSRPGQAFHSTVTVVWHLRWFANDGQGGDLGELASPATGFDLQVVESQALVAPGGK